MPKEVYYVKSFEDDFVLKTIKGKRKVPFQSIQNVIKNKIIKPNTKSFGRKLRLSTTIIHKNYLKTYRSQGIIFTTKQKPDYILPFDLVILTAAEKIVVHYYRIKKKLHLYYNHNLITGFERYIFKDLESLTKKFPTLDSVWKSVNNFRKSHGFNTLPKQKYRLIQYDEAVFHKLIKIEPIAIFGYKKNSYEIAKRLGLPHYASAKEFYNKYKKKI